MITICTVLRSQKFYTPEWVDKMYKSLQKHLSIPFNFIPLSDGTHNYPVNRFTQNYTGYWNKIELFRPSLYCGPTLFIDADNVIIGDLAKMINALKGHSFVMYKSRVTPWHLHPTPASCIMYWEDDVSYIWNKWLEKSPADWYKEYKVNRGTGRKGDQGFIREHAHHVELLQDIYPEAENEVIFVSGEQPVLDNASMLIFAGKNKPYNCKWSIIKSAWQDI